MANSTADTPDVSETKLAKMRIKDLREHARERGIEGADDMHKPELLLMVKDWHYARAHDGQHRPDAPAAARNSGSAGKSDSKADAKKKDEKKKADAEAKKKADAKKKAEDEKRAEEKKKAEDRKKAEAEKKADEKKKAEAKKKEKAEDDGKRDRKKVAAKSDSKKTEVKAVAKKPDSKSGSKSESRKSGSKKIDLEKQPDAEPRGMKINIKKSGKGRDDAHRTVAAIRHRLAQVEDALDDLEADLR
jgi:membrane protein involved in colicin uptake